MGNFSSCTAGLDSLSTSPPLNISHTPPHVARVLLIDGSMLKFRAPIKVIKLLLDYPNHLICPLDSLTPGLHSLSSLLPDEKLQLGRLYLLLPFKSTMHMQESCIKSKLQQKIRDPNKAGMQEIREERTRLLPGDNSGVGFPSHANSGVGFSNFYKKGDVGVHDNRLQASSQVVQEKQKSGKCSTGQQKKHGNTMKSEVGAQDCAELRKNMGDMGPQCRRRSATGSYGKLSDQKRRPGMNMRRELIMRNINKSKEAGQCTMSASKACDSKVISPLCDTPELQRAYRSFLLRRSCSWTPRLQPILERR